ncbi:MAG: di-trans,poly-cis-decaprenylcistransferase [Chloroflexi bacterium]|nr:di-trans,poly-cis-decaprenylcistransferase [Chloroflexota bacterium]
MKSSSLPGHIAIIMDGNGRWAEQRGLSRLEGHQAGVNNTRNIVKWLNRRGVGYVTLYAFSTENWHRPDNEVRGLLRLLAETIERETMELHRNGFRVKHLGSLEELSPEARQSISRAVELTRGNPGMTVSFAFNYGGRFEIINAVRRLLDQRLPPDEVDEKLFERFLYTAGLPDVDLVIRTGGELRISNFLMWQTAYSELYFTPVLWPDFDEEELDKALDAYSRRQRRFGGLSA